MDPGFNPELKTQNIVLSLTIPPDTFSLFLPPCNFQAKESLNLHLILYILKIRLYYTIYMFGSPSPHVMWHPLARFWDAEWMLSSSPRHHRWGWKNPPCHFHLLSPVIQSVSAHLSLCIPSLRFRAAHLFTFLTIHARIPYLFSFHISNVWEEWKYQSSLDSDFTISTKQT